MILVTGGAGFIGAHATLALIEAGHDVTVLDSLVNGHPEAIARIGRIAGRSPRLVIGDVRDRVLVERLLRDGCKAVLHFAGLKAVGTSVADPARYYDANVAGACTLIGAMRSCGVRRLIFSSSATVYGVPQILPMAETHPLDPVNPYGRSKLMVEAMLGDLAASDPDWRIVALRYFNPVGAHESGLIGEDPEGTPDNLLPYVLQTAVGRHPHVRVFGNDYPTPDGTGVRDYIHVCDLASGHLRALERLAPGFAVVNLGRGSGASVLEVISAVGAASGQPVPWRLHPRRPGDVAELVADASLALRHLGWCAERSLADACRDAWRWQRRNPEGYGLRTFARRAS